MKDERYKQLMADVGMPNSRSLLIALKQVANEVAQEQAAKIERLEGARQAINVVFDGPPSNESGRFVEVETDDGKGINAGEWIERPDGLWALRIADLPTALEDKP